MATHCRVAYLRGLMLAHGSLSITANGHAPRAGAAGAFAAETRDLVAALGFPAGARLRRGRGVLTWKDSDAIIGVLRRLGSSAAALDIEGRLLGRSLQGHMNRVVNAESANLRRAVEAAHRQLSNIEVLEQTDGLRRLSAERGGSWPLRRRSPEATFGELASAVGMSRSQVQRAFDEVETRRTSPRRGRVTAAARPVIVAANWKMNTTPLDAGLLANDIADATAVAGVTRVICPPSVCLHAVVRALEDTDVEVGVQNIHAEPFGAYTGEISAPMVVGLATWSMTPRAAPHMSRVET